MCLKPPEIRSRGGGRFDLRLFLEHGIGDVEAERRPSDGEHEPDFRRGFDFVAVLEEQLFEYPIVFFASVHGLVHLFGPSVQFQIEDIDLIVEEFEGGRDPDESFSRKFHGPLEFQMRLDPGEFRPHFANIVVRAEFPTAFDPLFPEKIQPEHDIRFFVFDREEPRRRRFDVFRDRRFRGRENGVWTFVTLVIVVGVQPHAHIAPFVFMVSMVTPAFG